MPNIDIAEDLHKSSRTIGLQAMLNVQTRLQKQIPKVEDAAIIKYFMYAPLVDLHDTTIHFGIANISRTRNDDHFGGFGYRKYIPTNVRAYDLVHDNSNASGISFNTAIFNIGAKNHGCAITDGLSYQIIEDHSWLNVTDEILIHVWVYLKANGETDEMIIHKGTDQWLLKTISGNTLRFQVEIGGVTYHLDYAYTPDNWYHVVAQAKSGSQQLVIDNVIEDSDVQVGAIGTNSTNLGIFGTAAEANKLENGNALAWLCIANGFGDSTWLSNAYTKRILNLNDDIAGIPQEITTFPYIDSLQEMPNSFEGMFVAS